MIFRVSLIVVANANIQNFLARNVRRFVNDYRKGFTYFSISVKLHRLGILSFHLDPSGVKSIGGADTPFVPL
jgi:hypothetical protein